MRCSQRAFLAACENPYAVDQLMLPVLLLLMSTVLVLLMLTVLLMMKSMVLLLMMSVVPRCQRAASSQKLWTAWRPRENWGAASVSSKRK